MSMKPTLVILAAGMGSRYGGLKQIDPIDEAGHKIIDFSIYDALRAGFGKVVFIIKKENEADFRSCIGDAVSKKTDVEYVFQEMENIPAGVEIPEGRVKPWGTAHAILCCKDVVKEPFAVINSDDYYGVSAYKTLVDFLAAPQAKQEGMLPFCMVGYQLKNTLTEHGSVARGCCRMSEDGYLTQIEELTKIEKTADGARYTMDDGATYQEISVDTLVSMNMWGFQPQIFPELETSMQRFFAEDIQKDPMKSECFIPLEVGRLVKEGKASVKVLSSQDKWFGVTYKEDKPFVMESIRKLKEQGVYPEKLWD
ncbi:MAG: nucleotidyltransferase [Lachnospiraceae bacterium]|nr:nucleotidyltransferase [Lachnospiraceae bacterium]